MADLNLINGVRAWTDGVDVEPEAFQQVKSLTLLPIVCGHVAVMPDVHVGKGATVGTVVPTKGAIIPAAVGVDIGCGMSSVQTNLTASDLPDSLSSLRSRIEEAIPVGFNMHENPVRTHSEGLTGIDLHRESKRLNESFYRLRITDRIKLTDHAKIWRQAGTLGGGNHFIELCLDEHQQVWVMLHSGSRYIGKEIGERATLMARSLLKGENLPDRDLAWLAEGTAEFDEYVEALTWAQDYAMHNRKLMMHIVGKVLRDVFKRDVFITASAVQCHHNYANLEDHFGKKVWITRKGAVSARLGELGIIPGSMGAKSFIVRGKGNADSYHSCSHGAGRRMSRGAAKRAYTVEDLQSQTDGVECRKDAGVIDEAPGAYKSIDAVMSAQTDLVEVVHTLKQVLCVKG